MFLHFAHSDTVSVIIFCIVLFVSVYSQLSVMFRAVWLVVNYSVA